MNLPKIQQYLTSIGVEWHKGRMTCPKCGKKKLTASTARNVAHCWNPDCYEAFYPSKKHKYQVSWGKTIILSLAAACQRHLESGPDTLAWFNEKRALDCDANWLTNHDVGAFPPNFNFEVLIAKAKKVLEGDFDKAMAQAKDDKDRKKLKVRFAEEEDVLRVFCESKLKELCESSLWHNAAVFIYTNAHGDPISLNIRQWKLEKPGDKKKYIFRLQPVIGRRGVFNPTRYQGHSWEHDLAPLIMEGEVNWLQLQRQTERWATGEPLRPPTGYEFLADEHAARWCLAGMAMGGKEGCDVESMMGVLDGQAPLVCFDNDDKDPHTGQPIGYTLVTTINWRTSCFAVTTPLKDMDEWLRKVNPTPDAFVKEIYDDETYFPRPYEAVAEELNKLEAKDARGAVKKATEIVWEDLNTRGTPYNSTFGMFVIEGNEQNELIQVREGHPSWQELMTRYGVEASDPLGSALGKNIGVRTLRDDVKKIDVQVLSYYDRAKKCLYVDELDRVLRINADGSVELLKNGDDDVIFTPAGDRRHADLSQPIGGMRQREGDLLDRHILSAVQWNDKGFPVRTAKQLYKTHLMSIFFSSIIRGKICPVFEGPPGSGKNAITQLTGMLFEGSNFSVIPMPEKEEKLDELTVDRIYVGFDEYDAKDRAMESAFRSWCTREYAERRELYTTWGRSKRPTARGMGLSTNLNPALEIATGQRQLMFSVLPRKSDMDDAKYRGMGMSLAQEFLQYRNSLWSEIIADLRGIVRAVGTGDFNTKTTFRMADFAVLMLIAADAEGWGPEARQMLLEMEGKQMAEIAEKNLLVTLLTQYLQDNPLECGKYKSMGDWREELLLLIPYNDRKAKEKMNDSYLRNMLCGAGSDFLRMQLVMKVGTRENKNWDSKRKQMRYAFWLKGEAGVAAGEEAARLTRLQEELAESL